MKRTARWTALLWALCPGALWAQSPNKAPAAPVKAAKETGKDAVRAAVERMQRVYEGTETLRARFTQVTQSVMGKRQASGEVWLKKPGKMRWDYEKPEKKLFIADGATLWVYEPEDEQAFQQPLSSSQLPAQVSFLFGKGRLQEDFDISAMPAGSGLGGAGDVVLKLVPRLPTVQYRHLAFVVDPRSFLVKETVVYDQQGGQNHLSFTNIETNLKNVDDSRFRFTPPPGTQIIKAGAAPPAGK